MRTFLLLLLLLVLPGVSFAQTKIDQSQIRGFSSFVPGQIPYVDSTKSLVGSSGFTWTNSTSTLTVAGSIFGKNFNNVRMADQFAGATIADKVIACLANLPATGGICDARGLEGVQQTTVSVTVPANTEVLLGLVDWQYCGTGDAFYSATTTDGTLPGTIPAFHAGIQGVVPIGTQISMQTACGSTANSLVHYKWTTHNYLRNVEILTRNKSLYGVYEEQTTDSIFDHVLIWSDFSTFGAIIPGHTGWYQNGVDYGHYFHVHANGGDNSHILTTNSSVVPPFVKQVLGYIGTDGQSVYFNTYTDVQFSLSQKSGSKLACVSSTPVVHVEMNNFFGARYLLNGLGLADTDTEDGLELNCSAPASTESIRNNHWYGTESINNNQHGYVLWGAANRNTFSGMYTGSNGHSGANPAYSLYLKNGTGAAPTENTVVDAVLDVDTNVGANKALFVDSSAVRNNLTVNIGANSYTISNAANAISLITTTGNFGPGFNGYALQAFSGGTFSPLDATTYYWAAIPLIVPVTTNAIASGVIPTSGTIKSISICVRVAGTLGTNETSTMSFRLNDTTDTTISSAITASAAYTCFSNTALSIAVATGDKYEIKWVTPTWATNPTTVILNAVISVQ